MILPSLLLHSCCAPCSTYVIETLSKDYSVCVYYFNPNIYPEEEYRFRVEEQKDFISKFPTANPVSFIEGEYNPSVFYDTVRGLEDEPERGARCTKCFELRLGETASKAKDLGYDLFATTLTISPQKDIRLINTIGKAIGQKIGVEYLESEFRKKNGYLRSIQITKEYGMYRQNYCGCEFSYRD